jgi:hypothetical protein
MPTPFSSYLLGTVGMGWCINLAIEEMTCGSVAKPGDPAVISLTPTINIIYIFIGSAYLFTSAGNSQNL